MIIDFHTHIFPDRIAEKTIQSLAKRSNGNPSTNGTVKGLVNAMDKANVDICVTLPVLTKPSQFESVTNFAISINENFCNKKRRIISFAGIHPQCNDIKDKMKYLKNKGFLGVKIHPDYQSTFIDDEGYIEILKCANDLDMIVVTHAGIDDGFMGESVKCPPELALKVINKVNNSKFVLGHYGGHKQWEDVFKFLAGRDVYFDTAFTLHEIDEKLFKAILDKHGNDKVLFATDCPWQDINNNINIIKSYNLDKNTLENILFLNALNLLRIKE